MVLHLKYKKTDQIYFADVVKWLFLCSDYSIVILN